MDLMKNMEAVLMLGFGLMCAAAFSAGPIVHAERAPAGATVREGPVQVIVVTGKRLTAAEKRALA